MGRSSSAAAKPDIEEEDFDASSQIAILRRAVAEIEIERDSERGLASARRELTRMAMLAEVTVSAIGSTELAGESENLSDACSMALFGVQDARRLLDRIRAPRPSRTRLETIRRKLHSALSMLGEALAPFDASGTRGSELERALYARNLVSDFYTAIPWESSGSMSRAWALLVANAELRILLKHMPLGGPLEAPRHALAALGERITGWQAKKRDPASTSQLYTELVGVQSVLSSLSARPEVKRHDSRALVELSALLAQRNFDDRMTERAVDVLSNLRGMDATLDRLIIALPMDPREVLLLVLRRVTELRARSLAS